ncbi:hypothetical protein A9R00_06590 [Oleispira antarctica]|uniref:PA14 domain-containing protein n=1 Tax=Oleispira antarctica TaxID=188908 RepID=A0A1Y5HSN5_OLEAN|nr:hypothetical protein A9R00_06590 [Oleispira antarctica]
MLRYSLLLFTSLILSLPTWARDSCEWPFRTQLDISGNTPADYQVKIVIDSNDLSPDYVWSQDGHDLRISDQNDFSTAEPVSVLSFWIESWDAAAESATIWIKTPEISSSLRLYLFYGNDYASPQANTPQTFTEPGIKFHTRGMSRFTNPRNLSQARSFFDSANDNDSNHGCTHITDFTGITNKAQFSNSDNFAAFSESYFYADVAGIWQFRYGADFGRGGGLYVNNTALDEQWTDNLWWANNWGTWTGTGSSNDNQILRGSIYLAQGYHKLEVLGFEDCCDGGITVQFKRPTRPPEYSEGWETFSTSSIQIHSRSCPVAEPTYRFRRHNVCEIDLAFDNNSNNYPEAWLLNSSKQATFAVTNANRDEDSIPPTRIAFTLSEGIELASSSGTNWACSIISTSGSEQEIDCLYSAIIAKGNNNSALLNLDITAVQPPQVNGTLSAVIYPRQFDNRLNNNSHSNTLPIWQLEPASPTTCSSSGVFTRFYNSQDYSDTLVDNNAEFDQWQTDLAITSKLDGQTILSQINYNSGNPFNLSNSETYFTILEANITIAEDGFYGFAVDGDDAVELKINDTVVSAWYGGHGASGSPNNEGTIGLAKGQHRLTYRHQEYTGQDSFYAYWREPNKNISIVPASAFFHCQGNADIQLSMAIEIQDSPAIPGANDKAIPGAVLRYTLTGENKSVISSSPDSVVISQTISENLSLFVNSLNLGIPTSSAVAFIDSSGIESSGLSYGILSYSNDDGASFNYSPVADTDGYDNNVTDFQLTLDGSMLPKDTSISPNTIPSFNLIYQVKVQ